MFNNIDEARTALHTAVGIIDSYVKALNTKDQVILRLVSEVEGLQRRVKELEFTYEETVKAEVSE